jgi:hypothetical protein
MLAQSLIGLLLRILEVLEFGSTWLLFASPPESHRGYVPHLLALRTPHPPLERWGAERKSGVHHLRVRAGTAEN